MARAIELSGAAFQEQAAGVLRAVRTAFSEILDVLPNRVRRPNEVAKALGIDRKLGWNIYKVVQTSDPFMAADHVPGSSGTHIFLDAARAARVPAERIDAANRAIADFERLIEVHAGDRTTLKMMLASCSPRGRERVDVAHRRAAFRANSYIWGVQARTQLKADFLHPGATPGTLDIASLRGFLGLRRIRDNVPWVIARARCTDNDGQVRRTFVREALDPFQSSEHEAPLLRPFCTSPLPALRRLRSAHGFLEDELVEGPIGNTAAITCITGEVSRSVASCCRDEHNTHAELIARMRTPCEALVFDQLVYDGLFGPLEPELGVCSELAGAVPYPTSGAGRQMLPVFETVTYLGKGPSVLHTADVPRYAEMARFVFDRLGWDGDRFDVYRVRMVFPPIPTSVVMRYDLLDPPDKR